MLAGDLLLRGAVLVLFTPLRPTIRRLRLPALPYPMVPTALPPPLRCPLHSRAEPTPIRSRWLGLLKPAAGWLVLDAIDLGLEVRLDRALLRKTIHRVKSRRLWNSKTFQVG